MIGCYCVCVFFSIAFAKKEDTVTTPQKKNNTSPYCRLLGAMSPIRRGMEWSSRGSPKEFLVHDLVAVNKYPRLQIGPLQGGPLLVINGVITPLSRVITPVTHL